MVAAQAGELEVVSVRAAVGRVFLHKQLLRRRLKDLGLELGLSLVSGKFELSGVLGGREGGTK